MLLVCCVRWLLLVSEPLPPRSVCASPWRRKPLILPRESPCCLGSCLPCPEPRLLPLLQRQTWLIGSMRCVAQCPLLSLLIPVLLCSVQPRVPQLCSSGGFPLRPPSIESPPFFLSCSLVLLLFVCLCAALCSATSSPSGSSLPLSGSSSAWPTLAAWQPHPW